MDKLIEEYHRPDERWGLWGINSYDEFIQKFMVIGKFHKGIPPEIIEEYKVVERLLCYSYYHFPLLDEAFSKVTRIFEAAVKLRMEELEIPAKKGYESLYDKIKKIEPFISTTLFEEWIAAKEQRNTFAHPTAGSLKGIIHFRGLFQMVNIINTVFLDKNKIDESEGLLSNLKNESDHFRDGLFKFKFGDKNYLIWSLVPYSCFETQSILKSFWVVNPVLTYFPQTLEKLDFSFPIALRLANLKITKDSFEAENLASGQKVYATLTNDPRNLDLLKRHKELVESSELIVRKHYELRMRFEMGCELTKFLYDECWN